MAESLLRLRLYLRPCERVVTKPLVCWLSLQRSCRSCRAECPRSAGTSDEEEEEEDLRCPTAPVRVLLPARLPVHVGARLHLLLCLPADVELEQIDFIDSCVEEEEEGRSRGGRDSTSLSSQFMAYIEKRITREVGARVPVCCQSFRVLF